MSSIDMSVTATPSSSLPGNGQEGGSHRHVLILLHTLVTIVLGYQLLFATSTILPVAAREALIVGLIGSVVGLALLPIRFWDAKWLTGTLVVGDTLATSGIIYLSGNASPSLYLTYFLIMLLAALAPTLKQVVGLALILCAAHGVTLYLELSQAGVVEEHHLLQIPILFVLAVFYGVTTESTRKLSRDNLDLQVQNTERERAEEEKKRAHDFIDSIVENLPNMLFVKDARDLEFVRINKAGEELLGYAKEELVGKRNNDLLPQEEADVLTAQEREVLKGQRLVDVPEEPFRTKHKGLRTLRTKKIPILDAHGTPQYLLGISEDITERVQAEEALQLKTEQLEAISEAITQFLEDGDWHRVSSCILRGALKQTKSACGFMGVVKEGSAFRVLASEGLPWDRTVSKTPVMNNASVQGKQDGVEVTDLENVVGRVIASGRVLLCSDSESESCLGGLPLTNTPLRNFLGMPLLRGSVVVGMIGIANRPGGYTGQEQAQLQSLTQAASVLYDSYRSRQREGELQAQLRQSMKMEAIGRLAGGIAHDFNNLLTVIVGHCHYVLSQTSQADPMWARLNEIKESGDRASSLTQQLLAFSRRQILKPETLDLNRVVSRLEGMLRRLIGEHIHLVTRLDGCLWTVKADPGQVEQVIMNLAINARDAMPEGGRLTIETKNVEFSAPHKQGQVSLSGRYVLVLVSDTGHGMSSETQARIFEPFFTTKEQGKGTGLGLATTYGIVKQSEGFIFVESQPGHGATFKIYLPWVEAPAVLAKAEKADTYAPAGTETILLVEDNPAVRGILRYALQQKGYHVLEAKDGKEAVEVGSQPHGPIHLLLTDLVMPKLSGHQVVARLGAARPEMKVLYMSGYSEAMLAGRNISDVEHRLLQKPFTPDILLRTIREVLDSSEGESLSTEPLSDTVST